MYRMHRIANNRYDTCYEMKIYTNWSQTWYKNSVGVFVRSKTKKTFKNTAWDYRIWLSRLSLNGVLARMADFNYIS